MSKYHIRNTKILNVLSVCTGNCEVHHTSIVQIISDSIPGVLNPQAMAHYQAMTYLPPGHGPARVSWCTHTHAQQAGTHAHVCYMCLNTRLPLA